MCIAPGGVVDGDGKGDSETSLGLKTGGGTSRLLESLGIGSEGDRSGLERDLKKRGVYCDEGFPEDEPK